MKKNPINVVAGMTLAEPGFEVDEGEGRVPNVTVKKTGKVDAMMQNLADLYLKDNPNMAVRWVYYPAHKPELANVLGRQAQGYQLVHGKDIGVDLPGFSKEDPVRVGDLVLMAVEKEVQDLIRKELNERASEQAASVDRKFYEEIENISQQAPDGTIHRSSARGKVTIDERVTEIDQEQKTSTE